MTISIMLDLETWGTEPGCDARSIGACVFDPVSGITAERDFVPENTFYLALDNPAVTPRYGAPDSMDNDKDFIRAWNKLGYIYGRDELENVHLGWEMKSDTGYKYPLTRDPKTVQWWSEQSSEARAAFADPVDLRDGLERFGKWLYGLVDPAGGIIYPDHRHVGVEVRLWAHGPQFDISILASWYRAVDLPVPWHYRAPRDTRTIMEAAGMDPHKGLEMFNTGTHHNALDDCITQARAVCAACKVIRSGMTGQAAP